MTHHTAERFQVYAGFSELLNRRSYDEHGKDLFILKIGYSRHCEQPAWEKRMREGFPGDGTPPISCPLALCRDWERIAVVDVDGTGRVDAKSRARKGIEKPLLAFLETEFEMPPITSIVEGEMRVMHEKVFPGAKFESNGVGELRRLPLRKVPSLEEAVSSRRFNDVLSDDLVRLVAKYVEVQLMRFARDLEETWRGSCETA